MSWVCGGIYVSVYRHISNTRALVQLGNIPRITRRSYRNMHVNVRSVYVSDEKEVPISMQAISHFMNMKQHL